ncbi:MAG: hypothetical protein ACFFEF_02835 [Candidatus Thorarchaeota archaeon]
MNEEIDLVRLEQATFRTANQDGLTELWMGLMILAIALVLVQAAFAATVAFLILYQAVLNEKIKEKYTYPRIGKVKLRNEKEMPSGYGWLIVVALMIPALAAVVFSQRIENDLLLLIANLAPVLVGIGLVPPAAYLVERSGLRSYYGIGAIAVILSGILVLVEFSTPAYRMVSYLALVGALFVLTGILSLFRFVRKYPILEVEEMSDEPGA